MDIEEQLTFVFGLPGPAEAPAFTLPLSDYAFGLLSRYKVSIEDLRESSLLTQDQGYRVKVNGTQEELTTDFLSRELSRGASITLRQLNSSDEPASFDKICDALFVHMKREPDMVRSQGQKVVAAWREAHNKLHGKTLMQLVRKKAQSQGKYPPGPTELGHELAPEKLMSLYLYGDLIHWDRKRDDMAAAAADPVLEAAYRLNFMEAMLVFAHLYLCFGQVIEALTSRQRPGRGIMEV